MFFPHLAVPETKFWRRHSFHKCPSLSIYCSIIFINKVDYNGILICFSSGCYKILHILLRIWFSRCKVTLRTVFHLVSGELTTGARSCFLYSNYMLEIVLCKISANYWYKHSKFWDSLHYTFGRIRRLPDLILL